MGTQHRAEGGEGKAESIKSHSYNLHKGNVNTDYSV
jgi:hypothetical protein